MGHSAGLDVLRAIRIHLFASELQRSRRFELPIDAHAPPRGEFDGQHSHFAAGPQRDGEGVMERQSAVKEDGSIIHGLDESWWAAKGAEPDAFSSVRRAEKNPRLGAEKLLRGRGNV